MASGTSTTPTRAEISVCSLSGASQASPHTQVRAYYLRGWLSLLQADPAGARPWIARAIATARQARQPSQLSQALSLAATAEDVAGDLAAARRFLDEAEAITPGLDDYPATIELAQARAVHAFCESDVDAARAASSEGVRLSREAGDLYQLEAMLRNLGVAALMAGDLEASKPWLVEAMRVAQQVDNRFAQYYLLTCLGWHAASSGQARLAAQLLGAAETVGTGAGAHIIGPHAPLLARAKESASGALGASKFEAAFEAGTRLSRQAAVRLALGEADQVEPGAGGDVAFGPLAKREVEVAQLVAEGLSNKQIGARLLISEPTVATHIRSIMNKLGFNARAQIASWMASPNR